MTTAALDTARRQVEPTPAQVTSAVLAYAEAVRENNGKMTTADHLLAMRAAVAAALKTGG